MGSGHVQNAGRVMSSAVGYCSAVARQKFKTAHINVQLLRFCSLASLALRAVLSVNRPKRLGAPRTP